MKKNGVQKFTDLKNKEKITQADIDALPDKEVDKFQKYFNKQLDTLIRGERDRFLERIELSHGVKNQLWAKNHSIIINCIRGKVRNNYSMPSVTIIAQETNLSRTTVTKHLKELKTSALYKDIELQREILAGEVLDIVGALAMQGDIKACKLYLEAFGMLGKASPRIKNQQNNFITNYFTPQALNTLSSEQIKRIEEIVLPDKTEIDSGEPLPD